nr:cyclase family protein [Bacillus marasmi]
MPVYPGDDTPKLEATCTYDEHGFKGTLLTMFSHIGTHMDAPLHIFENRTSLGDFPIDHFIDKGLVINCSNLAEGHQITMKDMEAVKERRSRLNSFCSIQAGTNIGERIPILEIIRLLQGKWLHI